MAAFVAFVLAAAANVVPNAASLPGQAPPTVTTSARATVTIIRAERVSAPTETSAASRSLRREAGKIAVDFH